MNLVPWGELPLARNQEEELLLHPLLTTIRRRGWINPDSQVAIEMPWNGRRVDVATITKTGVTASYELKIGSFQRVLEQAMYNRLSFDRSWVVVRDSPLSHNLEQALENGVGVIVWREGMKVICPAVRQVGNPRIRSRLQKAFLRKRVS